MNKFCRSASPLTAGCDDVNSDAYNGLAAFISVTFASASLTVATAWHELSATRDSSTRDFFKLLGFGSPLAAAAAAVSSPAAAASGPPAFDFFAFCRMTTVRVRNLGSLFY